MTAVPKLPEPGDEHCIARDARASHDGRLAIGHQIPEKRTLVFEVGDACRRAFEGEPPEIAVVVPSGMKVRPQNGKPVKSADVEIMTEAAALFRRLQVWNETPRAPAPN